MNFIFFLVLTNQGETNYYMIYDGVVLNDEDELDN